MKNGLLFKVLAYPLILGASFGTVFGVTRINKLKTDNQNLTETVAKQAKEKDDLSNQLTISLSNQKQTSGLITGTFIVPIEIEVDTTSFLPSDTRYQITENEFIMLDVDGYGASINIPIISVDDNKFEIKYEDILFGTLAPDYEYGSYWLTTGEKVTPANTKMLLVKESSYAGVVYEYALQEYIKNSSWIVSLKEQLTNLSTELAEQKSQNEILTNENTELLRRVELNDGLKGIYHTSNFLENLIAQKNDATNQISAKEQELADLERLETSEENTAKKTTLTEEITQLKEEVNLCQTYFLDGINKILEITNDLVNTDFSIFMGDNTEQFNERLIEISTILSELSSKIELGGIDMGSDDVLSQTRLVRDISTTLILEY